MSTYGTGSYGSPSGTYGSLGTGTPAPPALGFIIESKSAVVTIVESQSNAGEVS